jgi:hypothetical protein
MQDITLISDNFRLFRTLSITELHYACFTTKLEKVLQCQL